ncbi:MAG: hypothetical protein AAF152_17450 [Cyanobacteria bacterium P01_A01_bin.114]
MTPPTAMTPPTGGSRPTKTTGFWHYLLWLMPLLGLATLLIGRPGPLGPLSRAPRADPPDASLYDVSRYEIKTDALPSKAVAAGIQRIVLEAEICDRTQVVASVDTVDNTDSVPLFSPLTYASEKSSLPAWLSELNLTSEQTQQVMMIDAMLAQELAAILTPDQFAQLQSSFADDSSEPMSINALELGLSVYQQTAVDVALEEAMQRLLSILSVEQRQQFFQDLLDERSTAEPNLGT